MYLLQEVIPSSNHKSTLFKRSTATRNELQKQKVIVSVIYRSPSQSTDEFDSFLSNFENVLNDISKRKLSLSVITGDFNSRFSSLLSKDTDTIEGLNLSSLISSNGLSQLINELTHIQTNSTSCIDLIFTDQENLSVNSGVPSSLHPNCHHQIAHSSFNLNIYYPHRIND